MIPLAVPTIQVGSDLKSFLVTNNILTTMAAVTMAFSTGTMIRSLVADIILPTIYTIFVSKVEPLSGALSGAFAPINKVNVDNFVKEILSWITVIVITFLLIEYVIRRYILKLAPTKIVTPEVKPEIRPETTIKTVAPVPPPILQEKRTGSQNSSMAGSIVGDNFFQFDRYYL